MNITEEIDYHNRLWYYKVYNKLIESRLNRGLDKTKLDGYFEKHHILPKCMGGKDIESNYVLLAVKEHLLAHMLLARIYPNLLGLIRSLSAMLMKNLGRYNSEYKTSLRTINSIRAIYSEHKDEFSKQQLGKEISDEHRENLSKSHKGKLLSINTKKKLDNTRYKINIIGPDNTIYESIMDCVRKTGIAYSTLMNWINKHPEKGYRKYNIKGRTSKSIKIIGPDGKIYKSMRECADKLNKDEKTIKNWIEKHPELGFKYKQ